MNEQNINPGIFGLGNPNNAYSQYFSGRGWYQAYGEPPRSLKPGDVVNIPPEVKHWHGAAKDSSFAHIAIEVPAEGSSNEWLEPVSDEDYAKL